MTPETTEGFHCLRPVADKTSLSSDAMKILVFEPVPLQTGVIIYKSKGWEPETVCFPNKEIEA